MEFHLPAGPICLFDLFGRLRIHSLGTHDRSAELCLCSLYESDLPRNKKTGESNDWTRRDEWLALVLVYVALLGINRGDVKVPIIAWKMLFTLTLEELFAEFGLQPLAWLWPSAKKYHWLESSV